jgi:hypothetical protein
MTTRAAAVGHFFDMTQPILDRVGLNELRASRRIFDAIAESHRRAAPAAVPMDQELGGRTSPTRCRKNLLTGGLAFRATCRYDARSSEVG